MTVLFAALATVAGVLILNGLPRLYHPIFNTPGYAEHSSSRFYLCVLADSPGYNVCEVKGLLREFRPTGLWEIPQ